MRLANFGLLLVIWPLSKFVVALNLKVSRAKLRRQRTLLESGLASLGFVCECEGSAGGSDGPGVRP